jgi:SWI/SNF-related matrix-associated actin-dependent regulator of chromatin subfamily A-like protein 1
VIIKPVRPDWFRWEAVDPMWCSANAGLPGLQFETRKNGLAVNYHVSHVPCLPDDVQAEHNIVEQVNTSELTLPFENSGLLRGYQFADLQRLKYRRGALLGYEMRCGKSPLAVHLHDPSDGILLITGPLAAREVWHDWIERVTGLPPYCMAGRKNAEPAPGYSAYFCHYDVLGAHSDFFVTQQIGTFVLDEMHMLQGRGSQRLNAVNACLFHARKVLGLTGTPMWNKPKSLHTPLHLLTPGAWGSAFSFKTRYADAQPGAHGWTYEGQSNPDELSARMQTIMARRTWAEIAPELPPTTRIVEPVEVPGAAYVALEAAAMKAMLANGNPSQAGYVATFRRKLAEAKIKPACAIAERAMADGHKVVMWVWHVEAGDKLEAALAGLWDAPHVFRLQSSDSALRRQQTVEQFREHVGPCILVASMGVGGVALDLSASDYAIFVELDWTPAVVQQAMKRTFHPSRPDVVVFLHTDDPVETKLVETLDIKNDFAAAVGLGGDEIMRRVLS